MYLKKILNVKTKQCTLKQPEDLKLNGWIYEKTPLKLTFQNFNCKNAMF